jgi:choline dehydrogenase-like flavoprotein
MNSSECRWLHDTVSALVYSLAGAQAPEDDPSLARPYNDLTRFVLEQQDRLPDYLRSPMRWLTLGFDLAACLRAGRPFHHLAPECRARRVAAWKQSPLAFQRDFIRYYESLATLALHSRAEPLQPARDQPAAAQHQAGPPTFPRELECELAVVGSGPGGAITATLLAEAGRDVVLIEEGPFYELGSCAPFSRQEMEQKYRNGGQTVALGADKIAYVEGCCVGGGSEINSGLYHRTPPEMLEQWRRDFQVEGLTEADLRPHFEACERDLTVSLLPGPAPAASLKLHTGAQRLGWKSLEVPRWFAYAPGAGNRGTRQSMTKTHLPRFLRAGGRLMAQTRVNRLSRDGRGWLLRATRIRAGEVRIRAGTVFLCAGAVQTPALLRRSGLKQNIGDSLRLHPTVKVAAQFAEPVNAADMGVPVHQVKEFSPRLSFGCSISHPAYVALGLLDYPQALREAGRTWPHIANYYAMTAGGGHGTVRCLGPFRDPVVRYHLPEEDRRSLAEGLRKLTELLFEAGAVKVFPGTSRAGIVRSREEAWRLPEILPRGLANLMTIHLFSSCPMGEDPRRCATDSFGRVRGADRLFVNDASLLCTAPGVNPQGTIMALARRNALHFLNRL